jgi:O-antigen ligase
VNSWKSKPRIALALGAAAIIYLVVAQPGYLTNVEYLGGLLLLEVLAAVIWNYRQRFFPFLMLVFLLAGTAVPMQEIWTSARWLILGAGALAGAAIYLKDPRHSFGALHLVALFCVVAAATSAVVSPYPRHALLKALSLLMLFVYGACGGRLALRGREQEFSSGLLLGCEVLIYFAVLQYVILHHGFFGNPNSLGAVMGVAVAPVMLWGILVSESALVQRRRTFALLLSLALLLAGHARAGITAATVTCVLLCMLLGRYRMLVKGLAVSFVIATVVASVVPLPESGGETSLASNFLFKGKKPGGVLGSRRPVWDTTIASIKENPWLGGGFGTAATNYDASEDEVGNFSSNSATTREHGSSYLAMVEGVGLVGAVPFLGLLVLTLMSIGRVLRRLWQTKDPFSPAVPIAAVLVAGLVHAMFEDWLFAVGYYVCVFFWTLAFMLPDLIPVRGRPLAEPNLSSIAIPSPVNALVTSSR